MLWPVVVGFLVAVVGVCVALFWPDPATSLRVDNPNKNSGGGALPDIPAGPAFVFHSYRLCVEHGPVTVTKVLLREAQGLEIVDWAVGPAEGTVGQIDGEQRRASDLGGFAHRPITRACTSDPDHPLGQAFAVSLRRTADIGKTNGFEVRSTSGTAVIPFQVELCATTCPGGLPYSGTP